MGISDYIDKAGLMRAAEDSAKSVYKNVLLPGLEKLVADSATPYDDLALALAKEMMDKILDDISKDEPEPAA